jgi:hypothetical protein
MKRATETFAWSGGLVHWGSELPAADPAVKAFPQFFEDVATEEAAPAPKKPGRPKKAAPNG